MKVGVLKKRILLELNIIFQYHKFYKWTLAKKGLSSTRPISTEFARPQRWTKDCSCASWSWKSMEPSNSKEWENASHWSQRFRKSSKRTDSLTLQSLALKTSTDKTVAASTPSSQSFFPKVPSLTQWPRTLPSVNDL